MEDDDMVHGELERSSVGEHHKDRITRLSEVVSFDGTPECTQQHSSQALPTTWRVEAFKRKAKIAKRNLWLTRSRYKLLDRSGQSARSGYYPYSLTVRLRFSGRLILKETSHSLIATRPGSSEQQPRTPGSTSSTKTSPLFSRPWVDETKDFNMCTVLSTLRHPGSRAKALGPKFTWYKNAVPVDAIFPPGIPLSAKEILAYYPHHVRWRDVSIRLARNNYRGADIMEIEAFFRGPSLPHATAAKMNMFQRDSFKKVIPGFKSDVFNLKHDRNLHTLHLLPGKYIQDMRTGFTVPKLEDLTRGLHHLASGLDARCMTECLDWYLSWRNAFTPPLELNVLHVQALSRALRIPLRPFGPQNLHLNALTEWKEKGRFEERPVTRILPVMLTANHLSIDEDTTAKKDRIDVNLSSERVTLHFQLPIRHVLTFPFLAMHGVMGEALKLGIGKAEMRRVQRENGEQAEHEVEPDDKEDSEIMWAKNK